MRAFTVLACLASIASAAYTIQDDYSPNQFASMFDFFTADDPTHGFVNYVDQATAQSSGLYKVQNNQVYMGVDNTNVATGRGRNSIRITSKKVYNHGLIVLDLAHMPAGQCGTWPAFWTVGPDWPNKGEIDIIEGVSLQGANSQAMHTNNGCAITNTGKFAGTMKTPNCDSYAKDQASNVGCQITSSNTQSYGAGFNSIGGGVYATEWTSTAVSIWFFPRSAIPADLTSGAPNPANWGLPAAQFAGACDIDQHVINQQIVFDVTFCGDWAGQVWGDDATCKAKAGTCVDYVKNNPTAFKDTYWSINSLKVYQNNGAAAPVDPTRSSRTLSPTVPTIAPTAASSKSTTPAGIPTIQPTGALTTTPVGVPTIRPTVVTSGVLTLPVKSSTYGTVPGLPGTVGTDGTLTQTLTVTRTETLPSADATTPSIPVYNTVNPVAPTLTPVVGGNTGIPVAPSLPTTTTTTTTMPNAYTPGKPGNPKPIKTHSNDPPTSSGRPWGNWGGWQMF